LELRYATRFYEVSVEVSVGVGGDCFLEGKRREVRLGVEAKRTSAEEEMMGIRDFPNGIFHVPRGILFECRGGSFRSLEISSVTKYYRCSISSKH
jgi:hypothetical protein